MQGPPTTMGCLECLAHGFKTMCKANIVLRIIQFCVFFLTHKFFLLIIKFLLFLPTCQKCYITLQYLSHNIHYHYFFFRHVTNVTNFTSSYKISPIIFTITIIFCRHVTNITSRYKISSILGYRAPVDAIISSCYKISSILGCRVPLDAIVSRGIKSLRRYPLI